jgi:hypothetical protein
MTQAFLRSSFGNPDYAIDGQRIKFERMACELERIAAWIRSRDANSEQAPRLIGHTLQVRTDSHLSRR